MGTFAAALVLVAGLGQGVVTVEILTPAAEARVAGPLEVRAAIASSWELSSVTVEQEGVALEATFDGSVWRAVFDAAQLSSGRRLFAVKATNVHGETGSASVVVVVDHLPAVTVHEPSEKVLASPTVRVRAECSDDGASLCEVVVQATDVSDRFAPSELGLWRASGAFDATLCLGVAEGKKVSLRVSAVDDHGQTRDAQGIEVVVNSSPNVARLLTVEGEILDVDETRILYRDTEHQVQTRALDGGISTALGPQAETCFVCGLSCIECRSVGRLTPAGAALLSNRALLDAQSGGAEVIFTYDPGAFSAPFSTAGDFVAGPWGAYRISTRAAFPLPGGCSDAQPSTAGVFCRQANQVQQIDPSGAVTAAVTGASTVTRFQAAVPYVGYEDPTGRFLSGPGGVDPLDGDGGVAFQVSSSGWTAYEKASGAAQQPQVWTRTPGGEVAQVTFFGSPTELEALSPAGETAVLNSGHRFVVGLDGGTSDLGGDQGRMVWKDRWLLLQQDALLEVSSSGAATYAAPRCDAICAGPSCEEPSGPVDTSPPGCACTTGSFGGWSGWVVGLAILGLVARRRRALGRL